jgi:hypothetical protein
MRFIAHKKAGKSKKDKGSKTGKKGVADEKMNEYLDLRFTSPVENLNSM